MCVCVCVYIYIYIHSPTRIHVCVDRRVRQLHDNTCNTTESSFKPRVRAHAYNMRTNTNKLDRPANRQKGRTRSIAMQTVHMHVVDVLPPVPEIRCAKPRLSPMSFINQKPLQAKSLRSQEYVRPPSRDTSKERRLLGTRGELGRFRFVDVGQKLFQLITNTIPSGSRI